MMHATRVGRPAREPFAVRVGIGERLGLAHMDWTLGLATVALAAFSVFVLSQATTNDVPGSPHYYVDRQALYGVLGVVGMLLMTRIDYSRFRELRVGIYTFLCASVALVFVFGFAARGSRRAFEFPSSASSPPSSASSCSSSPSPGSSSTAPGGARRGSARSAISVSDWPRRPSFSSSRTSVPRWCSRSPPSA